MFMMVSHYESTGSMINDHINDNHRTIGPFESGSRFHHTMRQNFLKFASRLHFRIFRTHPLFYASTNRHGLSIDIMGYLSLACLHTFMGLSENYRNKTLA